VELEISGPEIFYTTVPWWKIDKTNAPISKDKLREKRVKTWQRQMFVVQADLTSLRQPVLIHIK
jgi:hypothetical protein